MSNPLAGVQRLFWDTAPLIYFIEEHSIYLNRVKPILEKLNLGHFEGFTSVVTLTEILPLPMKTGNTVLVRKHQSFLLESEHLSLVTINASIAFKAAELRSSHNLRTPDALQIAAALSISADAFLTNDRQLRRVTELPVLILDELE